MKPNRLAIALAAAGALSLTSATQSFAQGVGQNPMTDTQGVPQRGGGNRLPEAALPAGVKTTFVHLGQGEPAVLYEPTNPGVKSQIAVITEHSAGDELTTQTCTELSKRGYRVLCVNNSNDKSRDFNDGALDRVNLETKKAVVWLKAYPGVKKVILWGHSGGSTVATSYQLVAENGAKICQTEAMIWKCPNSLNGMTAADGVILGDGVWGIAPNVLNAIDPSIEMDNGKKITHPELDSFSPANGFNPAGSHYSPEFIKRFQRAQAVWNNKMVDLALKKYADIKAGKGAYDDDEPFIMAGAIFSGQKLYASDSSLFNHTAKPWPLIHPDGSITNEIIHSVRVPTKESNPSHNYYNAALKTTVTGFLSTYAVRVDPDKYAFSPNGVTGQTGIDWNSSRASIPGNLEGITVPLLLMGMTGSFEMSVAETAQAHAKSADKELVYIEGASHGYPTCKACEKTPGQYGDTVKTLYDYADKWLSKPGRFMP